jgi:hypothetical protein
MSPYGSPYWSHFTNDAEVYVNGNAFASGEPSSRILAKRRSGRIALTSCSKFCGKAKEVAGMGQTPLKLYGEISSSG